MILSLIIANQPFSTVKQNTRIRHLAPEPEIILQSGQYDGLNLEEQGISDQVMDVSFQLAHPEGYYFQFFIISQ